MYIDGHAFKENCDEIMAERRSRYEEIKHHVGVIDMKRTPAYGHGKFSGTLKTDEEKQLTELDIALIADRGNLCFGATCVISGDRFSGEYYTD
jgi:hypothetical protein